MKFCDRLPLVPRLCWLLLSLPLVLACNWEASGKGTKAPSGAPVTVAAVVQQDVPIEVRAFGLVEASSTVDITPQVTGLVTEVHFKEGDSVKKGDLLFTIDTRPYRASLALAQAELERNRVVAEQAALEAERYRNLRKEGVASDQELAKAQADAASAAAAVTMGRAQAQSANLNVSFTRVVSPMDGRTGDVLVHAGNVVQANDPRPLVQIRNLSPVRVRFAIPQEYLPKVRERLAQTELVVRATPRGSDSPPSLGRLTFLENTIDSATGTLGLKGTFANVDLKLWPGAAVDVVLVLDTEKARIVAPEAAIQVGQSGSYAYVVENGKALQRPVKVVRTSDDIAIISEGLAPGQKVVTDGQVRLRNGTTVMVKPAAAASASGANASAGATSG